MTEKGIGADGCSYIPFCPSPKLTSVSPAGKLLKLSSWLGSWFLSDMIAILFSVFRVSVFQLCGDSSVDVFGYDVLTEYFGLT